VLFDGLRVLRLRKGDGGGNAKCSCESPAPQCGLQTFGCRMQPGAPPRQHASLVEDEFTVTLGHPDQSGSRGTSAATDTRSYSIHPTPHHDVRSPALRAGRRHSITLSGWMSILAPVS